MNYEDMGKIAYAAFWKYIVENKYELGIADKLPPTWDKLPPRVQQAWERVAETLFRTIRELVEGEVA